MGGEDQLRGFIKQGIQLQDLADKVDSLTAGALALALFNVKRLVETMPEEGLMRTSAWRKLEPLVRVELEQYADELGPQLVRTLDSGSTAMRDASVSEFENAGVELPPEVSKRRQRVPQAPELALGVLVGGITVQKLFGLDPANPLTGSRRRGAPIDSILFKSVDRFVRAGFLRDSPTQAIADAIATDAMARGQRGVKLTAPAARKVRAQTRAIARTATSDMAHGIKDLLAWENRELLEGKVWLWSTLLDSRTCPSCAPLDQLRWEQGDANRPYWPLHHGCRCQLILIDPTDEFWDNPERKGLQIRPEDAGVYKGAQAISEPGKYGDKKYWERAIVVKAEDGRPPVRYSDVLARWADSSNTSLEEALGKGRAAWFKREYKRTKTDPQVLLQRMLTNGSQGNQTWIPLKQLRAKTSD
jgi:hypothetical protein